MAGTGRARASGYSHTHSRMAEERLHSLERAVDELVRKLESKVADYQYLMHKRKSMEGQYEDWLRRKQAANRRLGLRTRWIIFLGDRRERLEAQRQGFTSLGWGEKLEHTRRMLARARERAPKWRAEHEAVQTQVDAWIERLEEAQAAEWMQERAVDEVEEKLHLL
eukprot:SAG11_NODE_5429_length_1563_cov_1.937158_1_plen_165_part_10